ncbi:MAG: RNA polymerase factor sigma-54 [Clostridiales Family XIII bacterium]|jgi:RNA polymerase sigma-54 factor|nr:RNA polymerase factor sigma-54 [Clostridiales Family XIII bacterium]
MKLGMELNITQKQTLALTPALIQAIRILGLSRVELDEYLEEEVAANPILEADAAAPAIAAGPDESPEEHADERADRDKKADDFDWAEYLKEKEYDDVSYGYGQGYVMPQASDMAIWDGPGRTDITLKDYLIEQLPQDDFANVCADAQRAGIIALYIIESLDGNGFLTESAAEIAAAVSAKPEEAEAVLEIIRGFEPAGVGAADVRECLILQLDRKGAAEAGIRDIVRNHLADVGAGRISAIAKATGLKKKEILDAIEIIKGLEPKPGRGFSGSDDTRYIIPDILIEKTEDGYEVTTNKAGVPSLTVSPFYRKVLQTADKNSEEHRFLADRLNAAAMLIKSLEQREQTIYNVVNAILRHQRAFFDEGRKYLKPLTLRKIGEELGIHESTVSRSIKGKYAQTPQGVFELKYFFGSGVLNDEGEGMAADNVKARIAEIVAAEEHDFPLSDEQIAVVLKKDGVWISRRTVAKYRDEMEIPSSTGRRTRR